MRRRLLERLQNYWCVLLKYGAFDSHYFSIGSLDIFGCGAGHPGSFDTSTITLGEFSH